MKLYKIKNLKLIIKVEVFMLQKILKKEQKLLTIKEKLLQTNKLMNLINMTMVNRYICLL